MIETQKIEYKVQCSICRILPHKGGILKPQLKKAYLGAVLLTMAQEDSCVVRVGCGCVQGSLRFIFNLEALVVGIARLWLSLPNTTF